ncbi:hypothetical protein AVEN_264311-1 [Araneus ventricosus]|uniref:Uncharacterized protein n=1 Tax=Araneus ventricosus TaxID=182803 RepID=A0A4Y2E1W5_ARAVE|nr:hypothetical protein AVEN_264311-1 [Araneus ventricosus]
MFSCLRTICNPLSASPTQMTLGCPKRIMPCVAGLIDWCEEHPEQFHHMICSFRLPDMNPMKPIGVLLEDPFMQNISNSDTVIEL